MCYFLIHTFQENYCEHRPVKALLESECAFGEGAELTFADGTCIPKYTGWGIGEKD